MKPRILVLAEAYLPGWKAGGPIRSLANLVETLGTRFELLIVTRDRDHTDTEPYKNTTFNRWTDGAGASVFYGTPKALKPAGLVGTVREASPDIVFLTGFFSKLTISFLMLRRLRRVPQLPTLLAPQGQFDQGALALKPIKKRAFIRLARLTGLARGIEWQASTAAESERITLLFKDAILNVASDLPAAPRAEPLKPRRKTSGSGTFVFISRISPKKNLTFFLELLGEVAGRVELLIYGPQEAGEYDRMKPVIRSLPKNVVVRYEGILRHEQVEEALANSHFFVLPTLGENFGHAIYEAVRVGRPVLISDRTPWRCLAQKNAGWDLALDDHDRWIETVQGCIDMDEATYLAMSKAAHNFACDWFAHSDLAAQQAAVFDRLLRPAPTET